MTAFKPGHHRPAKSGMSRFHPVKPFAARRDHRSRSTRVNGSSRPKAVAQASGSERLFVPLSGHSVVKYRDTDVGFLCLLPLSVFLEEDKGPDHDVLAASGVGGRGWVDTGSMERPARDG